MQLLIFFLLTVNFTKPDTLHLAADLQRDKQILHHGHGSFINSRSRQDYQLFEKYTTLNLVKFNYSKRKVCNHVINKWTNAAKKLVIYQVESAINVDSTFKFIRIDSDSTNKGNNRYYVKTRFRYRTYIINDGGKPQLIYLTEQKGRLCEYWIGNYIVHPSYEDIAIGQVYPDIKEILSIIKYGK